MFLCLAPESPGWVCSDFLESHPKQSQWDSDLRGIGTEDFMFTSSWSSPPQNLGPSSYVTWHQSHVPLTSVFSTHKSSALCLDLVSQRRDVEMPLWKHSGVFVAFTSWTSLSPLTGHNFPNSVCLSGSVPSHDCFIFYPPFSVVISEEISSVRPSIIPSLLKFLSKIQCIILSDDKISPNLSDGSLFYLFLVES